MVSNEAGDGYRARAGALTLMHMTSSVDRNVLRSLLASIVVGDPPPIEAEAELRRSIDGSPGEEDEDEDADDPEVDEDEDEDDDEDEEDADDEADGADRLDEDDPDGDFATSILERWLLNCPRRPLTLGDEESGAAIAALVCAWETTAMHAFGAGPLTAGELDRAVWLVGRDTLELRISEMLETGLLEPAGEFAGETRYEATNWLREGIAPLAAATRMECHNPMADAAPPDALDVVGAFTLALPLLHLPAFLSGHCRLGVRLLVPVAEPAGVTVRVDAGRVVSCERRLDDSVGTGASASPVDWLDTLAEPGLELVEAGGDTDLARALLDGLHDRLFWLPGR